MGAPRYRTPPPLRIGWLAAAALAAGSVASVPAPAGDCDASGIEDAIEIARGTSEDLDLDGVPDACERGADALPLTFLRRLRLERHVVTGDLDGDARLDLIGIVGSAGIWAARGDGQGGFS